jgi:hypothetical protein
MNFITKDSKYKNIEVLDHPFICQITGRTGSGKTLLNKWYVYNLVKKQCYNSVLIFSSSGLDNDNYSYIDKKYIHIRYDEMILKKYSKLHRDNKDIKGLVIFDDIFGQITYTSKFLQHLFRLHRQWKLSFIFSCHHLKEVPLAIRGLNHQFISFKYKSKDTLTDMHTEFAPDIDREKFFKAFQNLKKHQFVVLNLREEDEKSYIVDKIKPPPKNFKFKF